MNLLNDINGITVFIAGVFLIPIATGILYPSLPNRIQHSFLSILNNLELITGIVLTLYLYKVIFSNKNSSFLNYVYQIVPSAEEMITGYGHNIAYNAVFLLLLLSVNLILIHLITVPLNRFIIVPLTYRISAAINSLNGTAKRIIGGVWQLPKSIWLVLIISLALNLYTNFGYNVPAADYINRSAAYSMVSEKVLQPLLGSSIARKLPVLINDSINEINENFKANDNIGQVGKSAGSINGKFPVIEYFNGVTLDEAIKSTEKIDQTAREIVGKEKDNKKKAHLIYLWICKNIQYDYDKAEIIVSNPSAVVSGSQIAFSEKKGVCFDYSSLYVSMCRAVGLKVRLVTGLGYNGAAWGSHSWNQVYCPEEKIWINVDATFGSTGYNSFDSMDFSLLHKNDDIQGEW